MGFHLFSCLSSLSFIRHILSPCIASFKPVIVPLQLYDLSVTCLVQAFCIFNAISMWLTISSSSDGMLYNILLSELPPLNQNASGVEAVIVHVL
jgi:hypothetical protein